MDSSNIMEIIDKAVRMATTPIAGARGITSSQRNLMGNVNQISAGLFKDQSDTELAKRGQDITQSGQNLAAETNRRGQDMEFGLGKEKLGLEKEKAFMPALGIGMPKSTNDDDWGLKLGKFKSMYSNL